MSSPAAARDVTAPGTAGASTASLVPVVVRLKLTLLRNGLRRSTGRRAAYVVTLVVVLAFAALLFVGLLALRGVPHAADLCVLLVAVLAIGWAVMPLFFPSGDETLDPTRLVMLPLRPRPLVRALLTASLVGIGPLFTLCVLAGAALAVAHGTAAAVTAVPAVLLALLCCVALARTVAAANIRLLGSRRGRDLAVLSGLFVAIGAQLVNFGAQRLGATSGLAALAPVADVVRWIPPASALGAVDSMERGAYAAGAAQAALVLLACGLLLAYWQYTITRLMTSPDSSTLQAAGPARAGAGRAAGLARLLPADRTGAVMERTLRYVWRDPKTKAAWVTALAIGLIVPVFNAVQSHTSPYFACFAAGMLGTLMYNQFGQDTSAFWMVAMAISTPHDALLELRGRARAMLLITLPYSTLVSALTVALLGAWRTLPEVLGLSWALLGALIATGAWSSARFPYSVPQSGYQNVAPGQGALASVSLLGGMVASALLCAPVLALAVWLHLADADGWGWLLLPLGAAYGAVAGAVGLRLAAPRTAARLPEILAAVGR